MNSPDFLPSKRQGAQHGHVATTNPSASATAKTAHATQMSQASRAALAFLRKTGATPEPQYFTSKKHSTNVYTGAGSHKKGQGSQVTNMHKREQV